MIAFRLRHQAFMRPEFFTGLDGSYNAIPDISWFDPEGNKPDWDKTDMLLAFRLDGSKADILSDRDDNDFFIMFNSSAYNVSFKLQSPSDRKKWFRAIDTDLDSPNDIMPSGCEVLLDSQESYSVKSRSIVVLISG
jgi:glycogen operon protein